MKVKTILNIAVFMSSYLLFGGIFLIMVMCNVDVNYTEIRTDPVYKNIDKTVEIDVYEQDSPIVATPKNAGKELILLDKSGSMEEFITDLYKNNVEFFKQNDVWAFDTELYQDVSIENVEFSGDTNVFKAVNAAADAGYDTIWLCSDLEHNTGEIQLSDIAKEMQIIVYSPKILDSEKTKDVIKEFEYGDTKVITIN